MNSDVDSSVGLIEMVSYGESHIDLVPQNRLVLRNVRVEAAVERPPSAHARALAHTQPSLHHTRFSQKERGGKGGLGQHGRALMTMLGMLGLVLPGLAGPCVPIAGGATSEPAAGLDPSPPRCCV